MALIIGLSITPISQCRATRANNAVFLCETHIAICFSLILGKIPCPDVYFCNLGTTKRNFFGLNLLQPNRSWNIFSTVVAIKKIKGEIHG